MNKMTNEEALILQKQLMAHALDIMKKKRVDYSGHDDPFANLRMSEFVRVEPWRGTMVRMMDKLSRILNITENGGNMEVEEALVDTFADIINYTCILAGLVYEELDLVCITGPYKSESVAVGTPRDSIEVDVK